MTEAERRDLFAGLERSLGSDAANTLMELLPRQPASELVTRDDMHANTIMLRGEMAELRGELRGEMAELRGEMAELRAEFRGELRSAVAEIKANTQRMFAGALAANSVAVVAALVS